MNSIQACHNAFAGRQDYYLRWYHQKPLLIGSDRREELRRMHSILYRGMEFMADHYREYMKDFIPLGEKEMEILDYQSRRPLHAGAFRPDYIVSDDGRLLLVEITCRFFGHGIWYSYPAEIHAARFMERHPDSERINRYPELLDYMRDYIPEGKGITIFKSSDKTNEIALYKSFYEQNGHRVTVLEADQVEAARDTWSKGDFLISALNQEDLMSYGMDTLKAMVDAGMVNDFRTILIYHDKRFLRLFFEDSFTSRFLDDEETTFMRAHTIEPILPGTRDDLWKEARHNRKGFIVKPCNLGKSVGLHAGCMMGWMKWNSLISRKNRAGMILQRFISQRTYPVVWEGKRYDDYICGMMLCVDDRYFDSGMVRASSSPVTNVGDDRRMSVIHSDDPVLANNCNIL